jgi:hypothetical protein
MARELERSQCESMSCLREEVEAQSAVAKQLANAVQESLNQQLESLQVFTILEMFINIITLKIFYSYPSGYE